MTTRLNELERTGGRYGLQTMCEGGRPGGVHRPEGGGQANVMAIERL